MRPRLGLGLMGVNWQFSWLAGWLAGWLVELVVVELVERD